MTYELALELKEAGFPQNFDIGSRGHDGVVTWFAQNLETLVAMREHAVYIPPLSELIKACGDEFYTLERQERNLWIAHGPGYVEHYSGQTPQEAVARLRLALNKKA